MIHIASGREGDVFIYPTKAVAIKYFKQLHKGWEANFDECAAFLRDHQDADAVPRLILIDKSRGIIEMEYLEGYQTIYAARKCMKTRAIVQSVVECIICAHCRLEPEDQHTYNDLGYHSGMLHGFNTLLRFDEATGLCDDAKFIDGGQRVTIPDIVTSGLLEAAVRDYCPKRRH